VSGVKATHIADRDEFTRAQIPGSFWVSEADSDRERFFWYFCPCGCGRRAPLIVGLGFKPPDGPSWEWNGSTEAPELTPSVNHVGHWRGWLRGGVWRPC